MMMKMMKTIPTMMAAMAPPPRPLEPPPLEAAGVSLGGGGVGGGEGEGGGCEGGEGICATVGVAAMDSTVTALLDVLTNVEARAGVAVWLLSVARPAFASAAFS